MDQVCGSDDTLNEEQQIAELEACGDGTEAPPEEFSGFLKDFRPFISGFFRGY